MSMIPVTNSLPRQALVILSGLLLMLAPAGCSDDESTLQGDPPAGSGAVTNETGFPADGVFTDWQAADPVYDLLPETVGRSSGALADRYAVELAELLEFGSATSTTTDEDRTSVAIIEAREAPDDALLGVDVRLRMTQGESGAWAIESIETRALCARGEPTDSLCP